MSALYRLPREALQMICDSLLQPEPVLAHKSKGFATLLAVAITSRFFHEHALNAIWNTLPGYSMLLYTLPRDAWIAEVKPLGQQDLTSITELSMIRPLVAADFIRLKHYAWRIKHLMLPMGRDYFPKRAQNHQPRPSVLKALADAFRLEMPGEIMLPNLFTLYVGCLDNSDLPALKILFRSVDVLFGPKLRDFFITTDRPPRDAFGAALAILTEVCPGLLSFNTERVIRSSPLAPSVSRALCTFDSLDVVRTGSIPISPEALLHLAGLVSLQVLECQMELDSEDQFLAMFEHAEDKGYFPALVDISLVHQSSLALPTVVLRAVSSPFLEAVIVEVRKGLIPAQVVKDIFTLIASRKGHAHMREVEVGVTWKFDPGDVFTFDTIKPLLALPELTSVIVGGFAHYAIDNYALFTIATAWPHLRKLSLVPQTLDDPPKPLATLAGLISFAQNCPELYSLGLTLNTDPRQLLTFYVVMRPGFGMEQRKLVKLDVGRSRIEDPIVVAVFLSDLFPELLEIKNDFASEVDLEEFRGDDEDERKRILADIVYEDRWSDVEWTYLPRFVQIRKQERNWGKKMGRKTLPPMKITHTADATRLGDL
ncbi:hypothetical protein TRAPUB_13651 [Trametes pubescens]|uniref:F-box domain-containing protein n=1 Tax=Trametes pubescens TaxID=154538 RepID=A0A1M2VQS1_TRAPU|nr:hypothetical protein TRAPUB_13651 [Trametes pubescens]